MLTYQDYLNYSDKGKFIIDSINAFKTSDTFINGNISWDYFKGQNTTIMERLKWFYDTTGVKKEDFFKANNQVPSSFYPKILRQECSYLLANGVTLEDKVKKELGKKFDNRLYNCTLYALNDGVAWGYVHLDGRGKFCLDVWRGVELIPIFDERTSELKCAIRFYQLDTKKPIFVEFYEEDGTTELELIDGKINITKEKTAYKIIRQKDILGETLQGENWSKLPIVPLYNDILKQSRLTTSLRNLIDLFDKIISDFGNNLEDSQDVFWIIRNYKGEGNLEQFLEEYKYFKTIQLDEDGDAKAETIQVPYEARRTALEILRKQIYATAMATDTDTLTGGNLTATAIRLATQDLDLKVDGLEVFVSDFVENILELYNEYKNIDKEYEFSFIRRTLINDTETIDNIYKMRNDIDLETALKLNPYISDKELKGVMKRLEEENKSKFSYEDNSNYLEEDPKKDINKEEGNKEEGEV